MIMKRTEFGFRARQTDTVIVHLYIYIYPVNSITHTVYCNWSEILVDSRDCIAMCHRHDINYHVRSESTVSHQLLQSIVS